jgi:rhodanese-related sulfurtransferase
VLLDVRTEEEWNIDGRPDGEKIGLKTYFLSIQFIDKSFNEDFEKEFNKLNIGQESEILTICMGGVRSQVAAELIEKQNYKCSNISDGFLGNGDNIGWKKSNLPCK